jgi:ATP adenylyltransferase
MKLLYERGKFMDCHFCDLMVEKNRELPEDSFLAESRSFYVKPGLGHFIEGYTLINSKRHVKSFSCLSEARLEELSKVVSVVRDRLKAIYGCNVVVFEHGDVNEQHHPGCCLDHAHLHLIPLPGHIDDGLRLSFLKDKLCELRELGVYSISEISYILYIDRSAEISVYRVDNNLPSQFLRREFCRRFGMTDYWDWAVFPFRDSIGRYLARYASESETRAWRVNLNVEIFGSMEVPDEMRPALLWQTAR